LRVGVPMGLKSSNAGIRGVLRALTEKRFLFFIGLFSTAMIFVFWQVLPKWMVTSSPDDAPFFILGYQVQQLEVLLTGKTAFTLHRAFYLFDPVWIHEFAYIIDQFVFALAIAYYLQTQNVARLAAYGGGLFAALSGYIFTLFCAGHLGEFHHFAVIFWSLGLINRCLARRSLPYYALLGLVVMWGQPWQPDIWVLVVGMLALYTLWRLGLIVRSGVRIRQVTLHVLPRFLLTALVAGLLGVTGIRQVFEQHLAGRDKQIAESSQTATGQMQTKDQERQQALDRWHFATGWSLPPEDCAEFLVPGIFGNDSFRPPYPYWGRLGQHHAFQPGRMMPNYRQHTVYLGLVPLLLAGFSVCAWFAGRRREKPSDTRAHSADSRLQDADCSDVPFWIAVWIVSLLLAMGRYTPLYRVFYAIPYMDYLRAPVKFLHFTEVATALLAGFGLEALLSGRVSLRLQRGFVLGSVVLAAALGLTAALYAANGAEVEKHITELGLGPAAAVLRDYAVYNCLRAAGLAAAAAALFWLVRERVAKGRTVTVAVVSLIILGTADLALVARRYVVPVNVKPFHEANSVIREMRKRTGGRPANVANYVTRNVWAQEWLNTALRVNGFPNQVPDNSDPTAIERPFLMAFQENPARFWQVMGVRFVILPRQQAEPFVRQRILEPIGEFELGSGTVRSATAASGRSVVLSEVRQNGLPRLHFAWSGGVARDRQVAQACQPGQTLPVTDAPAPLTPSVRPPQPVAFTQVRGERGVWVTRVECEAPEPGLLVWNERYTPDLVAWIDGRGVPVRQADGLWCAVEVPAGRHQVSCRVAYRPLWNGVAAGVTLLVLLSGGIMLAQQKRPEDA
jgi:hypothetical protein